MGKELPYTLTGKLLTAKLHELARDVMDCEGEGGELTMQTRTEVLAREVWNAALGIQVVIDEQGVRTVKFTHKPTPWAVVITALIALGVGSFRLVFAVTTLVV